jgi:hypothetical protein
MSTEEPNPPRTPPAPPVVTPRRHWTLGAVALFALGLLIAVPSGLCTGLFGFMAFIQPDGLGPMLPMVALYGGVPLLFGALLIWAGLSLRKRG